MSNKYKEYEECKRGKKEFVTLKKKKGEKEKILMEKKQKIQELNKKLEDYEVKKAPLDLQERKAKQNMDKYRKVKY